MIGRTNHLCDRFHRRTGRWAFTFVELCIGLVVIALVLSAAAAFSLSTAQAWEQGATTDPVTGEQITAQVQVLATMAAERLENELSSAQSAGGYYAGSLTDPTAQQAELMLWTSDPNQDHVIDANELELIEYDATDHMLVKYIPSTSTVAPSSDAQFNDPTWIASYRATATMIPLARFVDGAQFYVQMPASNAQKPLVEYQLRFVRNGQTITRYGAICMCDPSNPAS